MGMGLCPTRASRSWEPRYNGLSPRQPALPIGRAISPAIKQSHGQSYNGDQTRCSILREIKGKAVFSVFLKVEGWSIF